MLSALSFITLPLVWLRSLLNIWHWTPQRNRATLVIHPEAEWDFRCRSNTASQIGPAASMDVCMGHFDLPSVKACEDLEQGLVVPYPLEIVGYASVAPVLGSAPNFHVSISSIPLPSQHMVSGDHISYEDDQYRVFGMITARSHTLGNGCHTIFVRGRVINKITGPIIYSTTSFESLFDTVQDWCVLMDSEHWQGTPGLGTFPPPTLWVLQHAPVLDMTVYHELSQQEGGNIKQKWGRGKTDI
jgi:hypothetical protein